MFVEFTTGNDSFRAQSGSQRRNVQVNTLVRVPDDGEGNTVIPLFAAFQKKLKHFRETKLVQTIPATANHGPEVAGQWYNNRHELRPGTEIMVEYKHRNPAATFSDETEHLLLRINDTAPLYRCRLRLPHHHLSAVPYIFFVGRFEIIKEDGQLSEDALDIWCDWLGLDRNDFDLADILDPNMEEPYFAFEELEPAPKLRNKVTKKQTKNGRGALQIRRTRKIRTRK